jgi:hypothetical protein
VKPGPTAPPGGLRRRARTEARLMVLQLLGEVDIVEAGVGRDDEGADTLPQVLVEAARGRPPAAAMQQTRGPSRAKRFLRRWNCRTERCKAVAPC